mgnify:CR=1 FL=1
MAAKKPIKKKTVNGKKPKVVQLSKKATAVSKPFTKTEILSEVAGMLDLKAKQIGMVIECLQHIIQQRQRALFCRLWRTMF